MISICVGQTGQTFCTRYKEHVLAIRNNSSNLRYSNHILSTGHTYGSITDTMKIMKIENKGNHLNTLEKYHIYKVGRNRLDMNDTYIDVYNPVFETLQELNNR
jgi:hypothetical protein